MCAIMKTDIFCVDCKHYDSGFIGDKYVGMRVCNRPVVSMVTGLSPLSAVALDERTDGKCGIEGEFFSPIPVKPSILERLKEIFR